MHGILQLFLLSGSDFDQQH